MKATVRRWMATTRPPLFAPAYRRGPPGHSRRGSLRVAPAMTRERRKAHPGPSADTRSGRRSCDGPWQRPATAASRWPAAGGGGRGGGSASSRAVSLPLEQCWPVPRRSWPGRRRRGTRGSRRASDDVAGRHPPPRCSKGGAERDGIVVCCGSCSAGSGAGRVPAVRSRRLGGFRQPPEGAPCAVATSPMRAASSVGRDHIGQWLVGRSIHVMSRRSLTPASHDRRPPLVALVRRCRVARSR